MTLLRTAPFDPIETQTFGPLYEMAGPFGENVPISRTLQDEIDRLRQGDSKDTNPKDAIGIRKAPLSTVPGNVIAEIGVAMLEGASKYGRHNYRAAGVRASVYYDAAMRHLIAWWEGEDIDPDSGMSHITKLLACMTVLRDAMHQDMWEDDRPPRSAQFYPELNVRSGEILDRYASKQPRHYTIKDSR